MEIESFEALFAADGPLATNLKGYRMRSGQVAMAEDIADAISAQSVLCAEAGTGVGKTYAYLVPALLDGQRVIVATHTRSLQDQLFFGDLPRLKQALGIEFSAALLKGRSNYYCHERADRARGDTAEDEYLLAGLAEWVSRHDSGDMDQYDGLPADWSLKSQVTSTSENCLGQDCPFIDKCCVARARTRAAKAQVVVANHHLLAADLALKDQGFGDLLARAHTVVVDEAHKWPEVLGLFFGFSLSSYQLRDLHRELSQTGVLKSLQTEMDAVIDASTALQRLIPASQDRISREGLLRDKAAHQRFTELRDALALVAKAAAEKATEVDEVVLARRVADVALNSLNWEGADTANAICWAQRSGRGFSLNALPLDVSGLSQAGFASQQASWAFVSATLSVAGSFQYFQERLGLSDARCERYPSPFDYVYQGRLYVPGGMGDPQHGPQHTAAVLQAARPLISAADGGAFILCTSRRAVTEAANMLREWGDWRVLEQGTEANGLLLERFRRDGHAILVGSASFWEGVDVPGNALRLVIIDRLPFTSPQDPVHAARQKLARERGQSPFSTVDIPPAAVALQQAVGRLLRTESDRGVVMVGDTRLVTKGYGKTLRASLPPLPLVRAEHEVVEFLEDIRAGMKTKVS